MAETPLAFGDALQKLHLILSLLPFSVGYPERCLGISKSSSENDIMLVLKQRLNLGFFTKLKAPSNSLHILKIAPPAKYLTSSNSVA
jgi:hypothetical protein